MIEFNIVGSKEAIDNLLSGLSFKVIIVEYFAREKDNTDLNVKIESENADNFTEKCEDRDIVWDEI